LLDHWYTFNSWSACRLPTGIEDNLLEEPTLNVLPPSVILRGAIGFYPKTAIKLPGQKYDLCLCLELPSRRL